MKYSKMYGLLIVLLSFQASTAMFYLVNNNEKGTQQIDVQLKIKSDGKCQLYLVDQEARGYSLDEGVEFCGYLNPGASVQVKSVDKNDTSNPFGGIGHIAQTELMINDRFFIITDISDMCALEWSNDDLKFIVRVFGNISPSQITERQ